MIGLSNMVTPKIEREAEARNYGKFIISPLERGYGITLGNALRRVLLSTLPGAAVTSIRLTAFAGSPLRAPGTTATRTRKLPAALPDTSWATASS